MTRRPVRIANFSGYLGDRHGALDEVMAGDAVDVLVGDYLAEVTLASLSARHRADPAKGYVGYFLGQIRPHLAAIAERGTKVVTNAGAFHPAGLAEALRAVISTEGLPLRVAHIEGDNLLPHLAELREAGHDLAHLDTGAPLASWGAEPISANAYLGGRGIAAALEAGADIVICGRVTDASLTSGPAAWWHGWAEDAWDALAGAVLAGHIIECGPHATGGNFTGFAVIPGGSANVPGALRPGYPLAEVAADGSSVITKHADHPGAVTVDTVTAQLVYEIQGPDYLNPDVTVHLADVRLRQAGPDRVEVSGTTGSAPPPTTKVALFAPIGHQIVMTAYLTGLRIAEKHALLAAQIRDLAAPGVEDLDVTLLGTAAADPRSQWEATVPVRIMATAKERAPLEYANFAARVNALFLGSVPGFFIDTAAAPALAPQPRIEYWPGLLPLEAVEHRAVLDDGRRIGIAPPKITQGFAGQPVQPEPAPYPSGRTERAPLGRIAFARSGDKGGNSNVGVWTADPEAWPWLRAALGTDAIRGLLPETADLEIVRHEFPHLRAVHFVLRGLLGVGGSSNLRVDQVGKAVGEYLLARVVDIPVELLDRRPATAG
ncbi:uncharacterized protein DUF1446 [Actinocorallia herbida]|uniref:Uncharacterized protein DUF1446 n=1 Tax=Actinocorallia herbida TaxID=58109 RepID=A0A3N1CVJ5_9ACTN|nr:acyclic terpene utilization AtuA family protein [Actinocorallia herbida]ROO85329.1 uncharacterized protein DUF1446 [Actinocorallia herbida]